MGKKAKSAGGAVELKTKEREGETLLMYPVKHLITYARFFKDKKQYDDLNDHLLGTGWEGFIFELEPDPRFGDDYPRKREEEHLRKEYYTQLTLPGDEWSVKDLKLYPPISNYQRFDDRDNIPLCVGDALIQTAWNCAKKLSPQVIYVRRYQKDRSHHRREYPEIHTRVSLRYVNKLFYPYLKKPITIKTLDHSIKIINRRSVEDATIDTLSDNENRGKQVDKLIRENIYLLFPDIKIEAHETIKRTLVRMKLELKLPPEGEQPTIVLTKILDAITHCSGIIWEWVDTSKILLIPGQEFGKFARMIISNF